jgi:hypothetical protein
MNYKKTGWKQKIDAQKLFSYLAGFKQPMKTNDECNKILDKYKILEGDDQKTIDAKLANLRTLYSEENQKAGVNYFLVEFTNYLQTII